MTMNCPHGWLEYVDAVTSRCHDCGKDFTAWSAWTPQPTEAHDERAG